MEIKHNTFKFISWLESLIYGGRYIIVPMYVGLLITLGVYTWRFLVTLFHLVLRTNNIPESELLIEVLSLVDISMIGKEIEHTIHILPNGRICYFDDYYYYYLMTSNNTYYEGIYNRDIYNNTYWQPSPVASALSLNNSIAITAPVLSNESNTPLSQSDFKSFAGEQMEFDFVKELSTENNLDETNNQTETENNTTESVESNETQTEMNFSESLDNSSSDSSSSDSSSGSDSSSSDSGSSSSE